MVELLREHCQMRLASPSQITCQLHPALGPFFSIISQKIWGGSIAPGSDLQLEIVDLLMQNLELEGSLLICAENPLGHYDQEGRLVYSLQTGKCVLKNVKIKNLGIDRKASNVFWKNEISFQERCEIKLEGSGEFYADSIIIEGHFSVTVKNGYRVLAYQEGEKLVLKEEKIEGPTWGWKYRIGECDSVSHPVLLESY
jgi:UTP---glucose-1-phosphate uridylyltransferase